MLILGAVLRKDTWFKPYSIYNKVGRRDILYSRYIKVLLYKEGSLYFRH